MFKFFRKIRHRLLAENRVSRYLLYALGEIVLVVIGILIALEINNWNENQKLLQQEKATIASLKLEFEKNLASLNGDIAALESVLSSCNTLLANTGPDYEDGTLQDVDSLVSMTSRMSVWDPSLYTLGNIKNSGKLSSLSNEELKILLIEWETFYANLLDWGDFYVDVGVQFYFKGVSVRSSRLNLRCWHKLTHMTYAVPHGRELEKTTINGRNNLVFRRRKSLHPSQLVWIGCLSAQWLLGIQIKA